MPTFKISGLPAAAEVSVADEFETNQAGTSRKVTAAQIRAGLAASGANSDITSLTGLTTPLSTSQGGTGLSTLGTAGQALVVNQAGTALEYSAAGGTPIGGLQYFAGATTTTYPGSDWLLCDGSILTQTTYSTLFNTIGLIADGVITWTARTSGTASTINALTYGNNLYVYAGDGGVLRTSTDAITWTARTSGTASAILALTYGNNLYVYAGAGGVLRTSTDAITWTARTSGTASTIRALTYGNNLYVYAGDGGSLGTAAEYSYNSSTEFVLPVQQAVIAEPDAPLYIKAT